MIASLKSYKQKESERFCHRILDFFDHLKTYALFEEKQEWLLRIGDKSIIAFSGASDKISSEYYIDGIDQTLH